MDVDTPSNAGREEGEAKEVSYLFAIRLPQHGWSLLLPLFGVVVVVVASVVVVAVVVAFSFMSRQRD